MSTFALFYFFLLTFCRFGSIIVILRFAFWRQECFSERITVMDITQIDPNMKFDATIDKTGLTFLNMEEEPFKIYGIAKQDDDYVRIPKEVAEATNEGVVRLNSNTAGGRVRFVTDSSRVAIIAHYKSVYRASHMTLCCSAGIDIYADDIYVNTLVPPYTLADDGAYEAVRPLPAGEKVITLNLPLYSSLDMLYIGVDEGASLTEAPDYKYDTPVVYYGSSITQGGCANRPGMAYEAILSRRLSCDHINLGFSGSAKGEEAIVEYMASLDMSVFVCDYDHNAPSVEHLEATHEPLYKTIRAAQPDLPIIFISRPAFLSTPDRDARFAVIKRTFDNARFAGDRNVYLIHGGEMLNEIENDGTVDNCHPTDLGFYYMAEGIEDTLDRALRSTKK